MTYDFIVNTNDLNAYKYRVLTEGIDTEQYMKNPIVLYSHNRNLHNPTGSEVIGRTVKLRVEDSKLIASIEFDGEDEFAQKIEQKVKNNFIRMASMYGDVVESSNAPELVLPGQIYETVTKSKLLEISIVDIGGNDAALKLIDNDGKVKLRKLNKTNNNMKNVLIELGLKEGTAENEAVQEIVKLKNENSLLRQHIQAVEDAEADTLVEQAVKLGIFHENLKDMVKNSLKNDFEAEKKKLTGMIEKKQTEIELANKQETIKGFASKNKTKDNVKLSFDYLQKNDIVELRRIANEEPELYKQLVEEHKNKKN